MLYYDFKSYYYLYVVKLLDLSGNLKYSIYIPWLKLISEDKQLTTIFRIGLLEHVFFLP